MTDAPSLRFLRPKRVLADQPGQPVGFRNVRLTPGEADLGLAAAIDRIALPRTPWSRAPFNVLAISGGAAGGAYGAGVLAGLSQAGSRPDFALVTGVSTGALIAPFAFVGPAWDERLRDAYTGGHAQTVFALRRAAPGLQPSLFRARSLDSLIAPFVDEDLLEAVAQGHAEGRRLFVATTDLDRQRACIWDLGAIATQRHEAGVERAIDLFRQILAASASLPGVFPPRLIACQSGERVYNEMHVDGGVAAPQITAGNLPAILVRSFDTMLRFSYRQAISVTATFCAGAGLPLDIASIPYDPRHGSMLKFDTASMTRMFDTAVARARAHEVWAPGAPEPETIAGQLFRTFRPAD